MALHPDFPKSPHTILDPEFRWFPADEAFRESSYEKLLPPLVHQLRNNVNNWRESGYEGAAESSIALLNWWFKHEHLMPKSDGTMAKFQYYFAQREAVETIIYLYDVVSVKDKYDLLRFDSSGAVSAGMFDESWLRFVVKMATGTGKTKVISLVLAWCYFHKLYEPESALARNFLVIAPNIIVLDRIRTDFDGLRIFFEDPVLPDNGYEGRNWRDDFQLTLHIQDDVNVTRKTGNIFLTNIHRVYYGGDVEPSAEDEDTMDYFLGQRPTGATTDSKVDLGDIVRDIDGWDSPFKAIVSVLMLKEGWDVKNVTTIVGLRAYSSKSNILPEQTLGRGLRKVKRNSVRLSSGTLQQMKSVIRPCFLCQKLSGRAF